MEKTESILNPCTVEAATPAPPGANLHLMHGRLLARNVIWNLIGNGAPMIVAVFCIPILIRGLGKDRFGVLALAWALVGYASLFDCARFTCWGSLYPWS